MVRKVINKKNIILLFAISLIGMTGCGKEKQTEKPVMTTAPESSEKKLVEKKSIPEETYGTIKDGVYTATQGALQMSVPKTWRVSEEDATILIAGEEDTKDCIAIHVVERDAKFPDYKQEDFEKAYNGLFDNLVFEEFERIKIGNMDAIYMKYTCSKDSTDIVEHQYMLNGERTYLIGFTDVSGKLEEEIEACMDSIVICK